MSENSELSYNRLISYLSNASTIDQVESFFEIEESLLDEELLRKISALISELKNTETADRLRWIKGIVQTRYEEKCLHEFLQLKKEEMYQFAIKNAFHLLSSRNYFKLMDLFEKSIKNEMVNEDLSQRMTLLFYCSYVHIFEGTSEDQIIKSTRRVIQWITDPNSDGALNMLLRMSPELDSVAQQIRYFREEVNPDNVDELITKYALRFKYNNNE